MVNCDKYISNVSIEAEINHNKKYIQEIEFELDEIIKYMDEIRLTKNYLQKQVSGMNR